MNRELEGTLEEGCLKLGYLRIAASGIIAFYFGHTALDGARQRGTGASQRQFDSTGFETEATEWAFKLTFTGLPELTT